MTDKAKLFMDGDNQAVRLPDHYRFDGDEVYIRQDPETSLICWTKTQCRKTSWQIETRASCPMETH